MVETLETLHKNLKCIFIHTLISTLLPTQAPNSKNIINIPQVRVLGYKPKQLRDNLLLCTNTYGLLLLLLFSCSIVSDSLQSHGLQPARLFCPWDLPGKNTGVGCHFLLQGVFLTQGSNPCLPHWQADSLQLSYQASLDGLCIRDTKFIKIYNEFIKTLRHHRVLIGFILKSQ